MTKPVGERFTERHPQGPCLQIKSTCKDTDIKNLVMGILLVAGTLALIYLTICDTNCEPHQNQHHYCIIRDRATVVSRLNDIRSFFN